MSGSLSNIIIFNLLFSFVVFKNIYKKIDEILGLGLIMC